MKKCKCAGKCSCRPYPDVLNPKFNSVQELVRFLNDSLLAQNSTGRNGHVQFSIPPEEDRAYLRFWGWEIVLLADGTWYCLDTSGG